MRGRARRHGVEGRVTPRSNATTAARPASSREILDPTILGEQIRDKRSILDLRVSLTDRSRVIWTVEPLLPELDELHSVFRLREEHTGTVLSEHLSIHLLQISKLSSQLPLPGIHVNDYATQVERWARFTASGAAEMDCLASENRIMSLAKHTLETLSQEPEIQYRARIREEEIWLHRMTLAASRLEGHAAGEAKGRLEGQAALLLKQLTLRFGPPSEATRACVAAATPAQLDTWAERVLDATSLHDVLAP